MPWVTRNTSKTSISIPVLCNTRAIAKGDELLWCDAFLPSKKRKQAPVFDKKTTKNAKSA